MEAVGSLDFNNSVLSTSLSNESGQEDVLAVRGFPIKRRWVKFSPAGPS